MRNSFFFVSLLTKCSLQSYCNRIILYVFHLCISVYALYINILSDRIIPLEPHFPFLPSRHRQHLSLATLESRAATHPVALSTYYLSLLFLKRVYIVCMLCVCVWFFADAELLVSSRDPFDSQLIATLAPLASPVVPICTPLTSGGRRECHETRETAGPKRVKSSRGLAGGSSCSITKIRKIIGTGVLWRGVASESRNFSRPFECP